MKAYFEATKNNLTHLPERLKAWPGEKWGETKHKLDTTDWPLTIVHFIGWTVRQSLAGSLYGMGALAVLAQLYMWEVLDTKGYGESSIPTETIYYALAEISKASIIFAGAGIVACMVINLHKVRLHRLDGHEPKMFVIQPTDEEAIELFQRIVDRENKQKIS